MNRIADFATRIKQYRKENNYTLEELAALIDIPPQTINRYELAQRVPKIDVVTEISEKLGVNPLWLQGYDTFEESSDNKKELPTQKYMRIGLSEDEKTLLDLFRKLDDENKNNALQYMRHSVALQEYDSVTVLGATAYGGANTKTELTQEELEVVKRMIADYKDDQHK